MKLFLKRIIRISLVIIILLTLSEMLLRVIYGNSRGAESNYEVVPEYGSPYIFKTKPHHLDCNNSGIRRQKDISLRPPKNTIRILSYGDSIGTGYEVDNNSHYPYLAEEFLNKSGTGRYEVLNMARGHCPSIYAAHLQIDVVKYKPDKVVVEIEPLNDISDEAFIKFAGLNNYGLPKNIARARYRLWCADMPASLTRQSFIETLKIKRLFDTLSRKFSILLSRIFPNPIFKDDSNIYYYNMEHERNFLTEERLNKSFDDMFAILCAMNEFCKGNGVDFTIIILPSSYVFDSKKYQNASLLIYQKAESRAKESGIPYIGMFNSFQEKGGSALFMDFCHPTPEGYKVIAEELGGFILTEQK